jgi:hypothetical protein
LHWSHFCKTHETQSRWKDQDIERLKRGGCYEREKQRGKGKQEGAAVEPQREEKVEKGEEEQVGWGMRFSRSSLILIVVFLCFLSGCDRPTLTGIELDKIDTSQDPIQKSCSSDEPMIQEFKSSRFTMIPLAEYKISGVVVSKETYSSDWDGEVLPMDLAIAWGKLAEPENGRYVTYSQGNRWYHYQWRKGSPVDPSYVISHSSNNHIIPANKNIYRAIKTIKKKDRVVLKGFLVNLKGTYKGQTVTLNTSLSRTDTGNGSCELFYVSYVRIEAKVYE